MLTRKVSSLSEKSTSPSANRLIADDIRRAGLGSSQALAQSMNQQRITGTLLKLMCLVAADAIEIYDEGGMDINEWTAMKGMVELLAGGGLFPPGALPPPPKPQLYVASGNTNQINRKLKT